MNEYHTNLQVTKFQPRQKGGRNGNRWWTTPIGFVKINFDGVVFTDTNMSGLGVVIRNDNGSVLASCSKKISQAYKSDEIETMATTTTLSFVHKLGFKHAILEGDSLVLINALKTEVHSLAPMGLLIEDVKMLSQNFDKLLYSHTKRNGNSVAHNLTKYAIGIPDFLVWMEDIPPHRFSVL